MTATLPVTTRQPIITLKGIKHHAGLSEETQAYTATIYVDGVKWAAVANGGHGGCDDVHPFVGGWRAIDELDARIKATYPRAVNEYFPDGRETTLESLCCEAVDDFLFAKEWSGRLRRQFTAIKAGSIYTWPSKYKPTPTSIPAFVTKFPDYTVLNAMPPSEALALIKATEAAKTAGE